jgi:hypothetical protein
MTFIVVAIALLCSALSRPVGREGFLFFPHARLRGMAPADEEAARIPIN